MNGFNNFEFVTHKNISKFFNFNSCLMMSDNAPKGNWWILLFLNYSSVQSKYSLHRKTDGALTFFIKQNSFNTNPHTDIFIHTAKLNTSSIVIHLSLYFHVANYNIFYQCKYACIRLFWSISLAAKMKIRGFINYAGQIANNLFIKMDAESYFSTKKVTFTSIHI